MGNKEGNWRHKKEECYQSRTVVEPEPDQNRETNWIKKPADQKYLKYSYF